ncbi:glutathione-dependent formaldehyde-activating, GFA [Shewanella sediminis HAW-EB3]|uniref:Glutathione-dependent formaldehyde-activating, GFA n=2 Tax=Shewanella sediminis TaxID=271097 RepID=A8FTF2_SHESH|nr:glutathione-dependent formaldehyde-activating, GFA [Shewanella sediminis HAW-EB3]
MQNPIDDRKLVRTASCNCGQLSLTTMGEPKRVSVCHCTACQKRTGSAFGVQVRFPVESVEFVGRSKSYRRIGDSGSSICFHFCPDCGGTLWFILDGAATDVVIPMGNFADEQAFLEEHSSLKLPSPKIAIYEERAQPWVILEGIEERYS